MRTFTLALLTATSCAFTAHAQYCMLPGRTPYANVQPGITEFKLGNVDRTSANVESMSAVVVETHDTVILAQGHLYTVTIKHSQDAVNFPGARNNIRLWIDYNGNKDFTDANETAILKDLQTPGTFTDTFRVPATAPLGYTLLRATAKMSIDAGHQLPTPCDNPADPIGYHGEMEDYVVKIVAPTGVATTPINKDVFTVFPNPVKNSITITFGRITNGPLYIALYDITGKWIGDLVNTQHQADLSYNFNLNNLACKAGMYYIKASNDNDISYQKILKID